MEIGPAALAPLTENCGTGASAMASLKVAVIVNASPDFTALAEYVRAALGAVVSTSTALVSGAVKVRLALLPAASLIVPPFKLIADATAMPLASLSKLAMV